MSVILNLHEETRPYKIDVFGLQDNFISVLQSYQDNFIGQIVEPYMEIKDDGTQTFSCKIPKFYLDEIHNTKVINPRWKDVQYGVLAENTRVLKIYIKFDDEEQPKIFPFIIDKIVNKRDKDFSVYKEITGNGLAFAELGKLGFKIELNSTILEQDFEKDSTTLATIDYWLDKVFPNEKDENGIIRKWLTPWSYEIRMDWRGYLEEPSNIWIDGGEAGQYDGYDFYNSRDASYTDKKMKNWLTINAGTSDILYKLRDEDKIYEDPYVSNWAVINGSLRPIAVEPFVEKARYVDCKNSNKYNITQTLAETFEVFCTYEYKCNSDGHFVKDYYDEYGNLWTGKKVIFFNKAIKTDNPLVINYQHNLQSISRIIDSSEIYTKMYVNSVQSETLDSGYVSIADTTLNPLLDDFILNFDYLYQVGSITELQKKEIDIYKVQLHQLNSRLIQLEKIYNDLIVEINELEADRAEAQASMESAQEQLVHYEKLRDSEVTNTPIIKNKSNSYSMWMVPLKGEEKLLRGKFELRGINQSSVIGYGNYGKKPLFPSNNFPVLTVQSSQSIDGKNKNAWYIVNDEDGFPIEIYTSQDNPTLHQSNRDNEYFNNKIDGSTGVLIYFELEYLPKNKYIAVCQRFENAISLYNSKIAELDSIIGFEETENWEKWTGKKKDKKILENERERLLNKKDKLNLRFERIMGPALREGYWQPSDYEDPGQGYNTLVSYQMPKLENEVSFIFDEELFEEEEKGYFYASSEDYTKDKKTYLSYIRLDLPISKEDSALIYNKIGKTPNKLDDFCIILQRTYYDWVLQNNEDLKGSTSYYFLLDGKYYKFTTPNNTYLKNDQVRVKTSVNSPPQIIISRPSESKELNRINCIEMTSPPTQDLISTTRNFEGLTNHLSLRHLYNKAGFIYSFLKMGKEKIVPVVLLNNQDVDYDYYDKISFSFNKNETILNNSELSILNNSSTKYPIVYPRIEIKVLNVNRDSPNFKVKATQDSIELLKFDDFQIMQRKENTYATLKVTNLNLINYIMNEPYNIIFQASKANEKLYLDAKRIARDNSKPKYSYEIQKANLPHENNYVELGQLTYINDYSVDAYKEYGYISGIKYSLAQPSKDQVTISNYKTKFEDLFSSISAQNEAIRQNQLSYNIAAAAFAPNGEVSQGVLQTTLDNNDFAFNFSNTNMTIDDSGGLVLTNTTNYSNGVYGQVALRGGGIFCSNSIGANGDREWTTGITPEGINASAINTGKLDTNLVRIFSGDSLAFQWNSEGLYAFKELQKNDGNGNFSLDEANYIRLNKEGLLYINNGQPQLELGWNGLTIEGVNGHLKLTAENGLQMFNDDGIALVTFGRHNNQYGMFFSDANGNITLQTTNSGQLKLIDKIYVGQGTSTAGISGTGSFRFWAGTTEPSNSSPFRVDANGNVFARNINSTQAVTLSLLSSDDTSTSLGATMITADAFIYSPEIESEYITAEDITTGDLTIQNGKLIFQKGSAKAILTFDGEKLNIEYK